MFCVCGRVRRFVNWRRPLHAVGVDFGYSGVKAVALAADRGELTLLGAGIEPLPPGALRDGAVGDADAVGAALGRLLTRLRVRCRLLALAIGGSSVLVKRFPAPPEAVPPGTAPGGLREAVAREAARHVPFHLESLEFDYEGPLPVTREATPGDPEGDGPAAVVFGAAPREIVLEHCRAAAAAGREATRVELEPYALHAAVVLADRLAGVEREPGALAIVEIGASRSGVHVFGNSPLADPAIRGPGRTPDRHATAGAPADLLASVPGPGASLPAADGLAADVESGVGPARSGIGRQTGSPGSRPMGAEVFADRIVAVAREAFGEAGLRQGIRVLLSGGGARSPAVRAGLRDFASGDPDVLDPLAGLGPREYGPAPAADGRQRREPRRDEERYAQGGEVVPERDERIAVPRV